MLGLHPEEPKLETIIFKIVWNNTFTVDDVEYKLSSVDIRKGLPSDFSIRKIWEKSRF